MRSEDLIAFEARISALWEAGELPFLLHLSGGNEDALIDLFREVQHGDWVLSTHRNHYHYLLAGGHPDVLEREIRNGNSMYVFDWNLHFLSTSILGGLCGVAVGIALGIRLKGLPNKVWCFIGDGAEDNGHLYEAVKHVTSLELPCVFVIEDNDRSVTVSKKQRGSDYTIDWPSCVRRMVYAPRFPHAGNGTTKQIVFKL